jgi:hypothetical protein
MVASPDNTTLAKEALSREAPNDAHDVQVEHVISDFLGGTMFILSFRRGEPPNEGQSWWSVLVRDGVPKVYPHFNNVYSDVAKYRPRKGVQDFLESQRGIVALISLLIIITTLAGILVYRDATVAQWLQSPLSVVLGFWFARGVSPTDRASI